MSNNTATRQPHKTRRDATRAQRQPRPAPRRMTTRQAAILAELSEV